MSRLRATLTENMDALHAVADALLTYETLSGAEVRMILAGESLERGDGSNTSGSPPAESMPPTGSRSSRGQPAELIPQVQTRGQWPGL